jgi:flagellin-like protein
MKRINVKGLIILIAVTVVLAACKKDDDKISNHLKYNNTEYILTAGIIEYYGQWNESPASYNFDITLFSSGVSFNGDDFSGEGHAIYFEMFSSSATELVPGTYSYDANETFNALTFDYGSVYIDYNLSTDTGLELSVTAGTVKIEKSGTTYKITVDCTVVGGHKVTGYYEGALTYYDWSNEKSLKSRKF